MTFSPLDLNFDLSSDYADAEGYGRAHDSRQGSKNILKKIQHNQKLIEHLKTLKTSDAKTKLKKLQEENKKLIAELKAQFTKSKGGAPLGTRQPLRRGGGRSSSAFQSSSQTSSGITSSGVASSGVASTEATTSTDGILAVEESASNLGGYGGHHPPGEKKHKRAVKKAQEKAAAASDDLSGYGDAVAQLRARQQFENSALLATGAALGPVGLSVAIATQRKRHTQQHAILQQKKADIQKGKVVAQRRSARRRHVLEAQVLAVHSLSDVTKARFALYEAMQRGHISGSTGASLLSMLRQRSSSIEKASGYATLTSSQKVQLLNILRMQRAGRVSASQAKALAVQAAPLASGDWTEHAALAAQEPSVAAAATAASPETATPSETAAASISTDTTAASAGSSFTASSPATVAAVYSTPTAASAAAPVTTAAASTADADAAAVAAAASTSDAEEEGEEGEDEEASDDVSKPNLKLYGIIAIAGLGLWYLLRPSSTTVVVR